MIKVNYELDDILCTLGAINRLNENKEDYLNGKIKSTLGLCYELNMVHLNDSCTVYLEEVAHLDKYFVPHPWDKNQVGVGKAIFAKFKHDRKVKGTTLLYPVGGKEEFFKEDKNGTLMQNPRRWELLDFVEAQLKHIVEHGTLGF